MDGDDRMRRLARKIVDHPTESWVGVAIALACGAFVFAQLHPSLILADTTPAGGDMGAHVWGPAYLRDHLLPSFRLTGWTPDWYAGFPAFQFYMLPPALLILLLDVVLPYGIAMKLVTVLGVVAMPVCAYAMGRLARVPFPGPPLLAVATLPFLFDRGWTIYGGNIASTLAGEYSFSISLSLAMLFFGVLTRSLDTGRYRGWAAALLALTILCHAIPAFFAVVGGSVLVLMRLDWRRILFAAPILAVGVFLTSFWSIPFILRRGYLTDMGWERKPAFDAGETYGEFLVPDDIRWVAVLAGVGLVLSLVFRIHFGTFLAILAFAFAIGFRFDAMSPVHIWNARLLPFYYLCLYLLAAMGASEVVRSIAELAAGVSEQVRRAAEVVGAVAVLAVIAVVVALPMHNLPFGKKQADGTYRWLFLETKDDSFVDSWARWNYTGYERKPNYPEYRAIVTTMKEVGETNGCGRAHWEYNGDLDRYGTPMAMMLLPHWTDGCIASMEGLYFESSATTPFHFLTASELSPGASNPQRGLPYPGFDLVRGIEHMQLLGVRYYMAFSTEAITAADEHPDLTRVAASPPWVVYEIADAPLVEAVSAEPAVYDAAVDRTNPGWEEAAVEWFVDGDADDVLIAADGPDEWQVVDKGAAPERREVDPVEVTDIDQDDLSISFDVSDVGTPVLVKMSYFPNWKVSGADGPYRVTPNLMLVIPTEEHVSLSYGYTNVDYLGWALTLLALGGLVWVVRRGTVVLPEPPPPAAPAAGAPDDIDGGAPDDIDGGAPPPPAHLVGSAGAQRGAQLAEADDRPSDPAGDGGARRAPLLDPDGDLGDDHARTLGP